MQVAIVDFQHQNANQQFSDSLQESGFAVIRNHPVAKELLQAVSDEWLAFYLTEAKFNYPADPETYSGYYPFRSENAKDTAAKNLSEFYNFYPWGEFPKELSQATFELHTALTDMGATLLTWLDETAPEKVRAQLSCSFADMVKDAKRHLMRIIHYPPLQAEAEPSEVRAAAHEDINLITLLPSPSQSGLQIKDSNGTWWPVATELGDIVINVGDMLQLTSQGYYRSTTHQVINPKDGQHNVSRMSQPLFLHPRDDVMLTPEVNALDYLVERLTANGLI